MANLTAREPTRIPGRLSVMRLRWRLLVLVLLAACAEPTLSPGTGGTPRYEASGAPRYEASGMVLESAEHGPELCLGAVGASYPPRCGGVPVAGWDWNEVSNETRSNATIWGQYRVVGTFDGTTFTPTEPPGPPGTDAPEPPEITTPCPAPEGGWKQVNPALASEAAFSAAADAAQKEPDFAGLWIVDPNTPTSPNEDYVQDMSKVILNAAFTGDLERHETELREIWGGALCVTKHKYTLAKLDGIMNELMGGVAKQLGLQPLGADGDEYQGIVTFDVVFGDAEDQKALDARYGTGLVVMRSAIRPVS